MRIPVAPAGHADGHDVLPGAEAQEQLNKEIRRRIRAPGGIPGGLVGYTAYLSEAPRISPSRAVAVLQGLLMHAVSPAVAFAMGEPYFYINP